MLIKNIKTILIILLFFCSIIYAKEKKYNEKTYIRNEEEAKAAYSLALFYKERALASKIPTEESIEDLEKAKVILKEVLKYINNNEINITLAETHEALGEYDESSSIYDKLISENPDDVYLLIKAAERNIFLMGDYGKAKYYLNSAYEIDSFNNDILILLGFIYYSERDFEKAVLYFEKVEPSKGASNNYMQYYNYYYGMSEFYLSRFKKALGRLKEVNIKGLNPVDRYNTLYGIIKSYQALENYKEAYSNSLATKDAPELSLFLSFMSDDYNEELFSEIDMSDAPKILSIILTAKNEGYSNALNIIETGLDRRDIDLDIIQTYYKLINEVGNIEDKINAEMDTISFYVALKNIDALPNHIDKLIEYNKMEKFNNLYLQAAAEFRNQNDFESAKEMLNKYISLTNKTILENELVSLVLTAIDIKEYDLALNSINKFEKELAKDIPFLSYAPKIFISALTKQRLGQIFDKSMEVYAQCVKRVSTGLLNKVINEAYALNPPTSFKGKRLKVLYTTQAAIQPPTFVLFVNNEDLLKDSYKRYLENKLREAFGFFGTPIRISVRERKDKKK